MKTSSLEAGVDLERAAAICYRVVQVFSDGKGTGASNIHNSIELLLIRTHGGEWGFPKGRLEAGEKAWQAAEREAFEEAGVTGELDHKRLSSFLYLKPGSNLEVSIVAFLLRVDTVQPAGEPERSPAWFPVEQAEANLRQSRRGKYADEFTRVIALAVKKISDRRRELENHPG